MNEALLDDTVPASNSRRMLATIAGVVATVLAVAAGTWYGFSQADAARTETRVTVIVADSPNVAVLSGSTVSSVSTAAASPAAAPVALRPMGISDGIGQGETVVPPPFYTRPPVPFDITAALADIAAAAAARLPAPAAPAPTSPLPAGSAKAVPPDVLPAGWDGTSTSLDQLWEGNAKAEWAVRATPLTAPNWRISGVVQRGGETLVMVQFDGDPAMKFLKIGDPLPGGGKLAWVKPDVIGVAFAKRAPVAIPVLGGPPESASTSAIAATTGTPGTPGAPAATNPSAGATPTGKSRKP